MGLKNTLGKLAKKYRQDAGGQIAVITALVGLPLLLVAASAYDISAAHGQNESIRSAIDAAALAAVVPDNMTNSERYAYAQTVFDSNYFGRNDVSLNVSGDRERVDITATTQVPTVISGAIGINYVEVQESTSAELTRADVVCVLALDPSGDRAIEFKDQAVFNSPACSVQANSTSPFALVSNVVTAPVASSFCAVGISQGVFSPFVKHACSPIEDPYANLVPPEDGPCIDVKKLKRKRLNPPNITVTTTAGIADLVGDDTEMVPGTYCKALELAGVNVTFLPGTYIVKKNLTFKQFAQVRGDGVTFVLKGKKAKLKIESDAQVYLKAPATGTYAGLVFYQIGEQKLGKKPKLPSGKTEIKSGGGLVIIGTAYFPTQELEISSSNPVASQSPATSFIAYRLTFSEKSNVTVHVDHEAGGIPPLLPRSDDGARLVR